MKDLLIRIDDKILEVITALVRRWVAKHEFKKHKIDLMIRLEWIVFAACIVWATIFPAALYVAAGAIGSAAIHALMWSVLSGSDYLSVQTTIRQIKPFHDFLFGMRENPAVYEGQKVALEEGFRETRGRRGKMIALLLGVLAACLMINLALGMDAPNAIVFQYLFFSVGISVAKIYLLYVFDFDPPKKKKKASEAITDLVRRLWGEFIGGFNPLPAPLPV